jgi:hypothetical protein
MKRRTLLMCTLTLVCHFCLVSSSMAQSFKTTFVHLGDGVPGLLYEPVPLGEKAEIGVVAMHVDGDYLSNNPSNPCINLAKRGYRALCANCSNSKGNNKFRSDMDIDKMLLNVKAAMTYLRGYPGIRKIVLFGHSGGGGLMAAYQNIAQNGVSVCQGPEKLVKCPNSLGGMPAADGIMLVDSTLSQATNFLFSVDPAVLNETSGRQLNPDLDSYNPKNGYNPRGTTYSDKFKQAFFAGQKDRMNRLIEKAQAILENIKAGKGNFDDDEPFFVPGSDPGGPRLFSEDISLAAHTRNQWPLLHPDGTTTTEIIHSVRVPRGNSSPTAILARGAIITTAHAFLSTFATRPINGYGYDASTLNGIDFKSNYSNTAGSAEGITVPLLQMGMTGSYEYFVAETIREHAKSADKTLAYVEGATHGFSPCKPCAVAQGKPENYYGDTIKTVFDHLDGWLSKPGRF